MSVVRSAEDLVCEVEVFSRPAAKSHLRSIDHLPGDTFVKIGWAAVRRDPHIQERTGQGSC